MIAGYQHYVLLDGTTTPMPADILSYLAWAKTNSRTVSSHVLDDCRVSTMFMCLNLRMAPGPPLLFETLILGGKFDGWLWQYQTWEAASAFHDRVVACIESGGDVGTLEQDEDTA